MVSTRVGHAMIREVNLLLEGSIQKGLVPERGSLSRTKPRGRIIEMFKRLP